MFSERFNRKENPKDVDADAYKESDPTTFSPLPLEGTAVHGEVPVEIGTRKTITVDGETYVEILRDAHPKKQQVIALLSKGIVPVADVVEHKDFPGKRYSKMMPHERIENESTMDDARAYAEFMWLIFSDYDHRASEALTRNVRIEDGKTSLYDFELASLEGAPHSLKHGEDKYPKVVLEKTLPLIQAFAKRIEGEEGKTFIKSALTHAGAEVSDLLPARNANVEDVQEILQGRVHRAELIVRGALRDQDVGES